MVLDGNVVKWRYGGGAPTVIGSNAKASNWREFDGAMARRSFFFTNVHTYISSSSFYNRRGANSSKSCKKAIYLSPTSSGIL
jgi:hypothetical protein